MNRRSSFQNRYLAPPSGSHFNEKDNEYPTRSEDSSEREWWPKTDTKAEWGAPPKPERYGAVKPNVVNMKPQELATRKPEEIEISEVPVRKQDEETLEVFFTSKKAYRLGSVPSGTGVVRVAVDQIIVPTFGHPFNLYVNGSREKFEILQDNCKDEIEDGDMAEDSRAKRVNVILDKKIERVVRELPGGGYEECEELTYTFPISAKITFLVATTTDSSTPSQPLF